MLYNRTARSSGWRWLAILAWLLLPVSTGFASDELKVGDRLELKIFEALSVNEEAASDLHSKRKSDIQVIYPRPDLSGELEVSAGLEVTVPVLGAFTTSGQSLADLKENLSLAATRELGHKCEISLRFVRRAPIYVVGFVRVPGSFAFRPGMILVQALALAGGVDQLRVAEADAAELVRRYTEMSPAGTSGGTGCNSGTKRQLNQHPLGSVPIWQKLDAPMPLVQVDWLATKPNPSLNQGPEVPPDCNAAGGAHLEIVRKRGRGMIVVAAKETDPIEPGDIIRVSLSSN